MRNNLKNIFIFFISFFLIITSCKKDSKLQVTNGVVVNNSGVVVGADGNPIGTYNILAHTTKYCTIGSGTLPLASIEFYIAPYSFTTPPLYPDINVNFVTLNGVVFQNTQIGWYADLTNSISFLPSTWVVSGNSFIPSFTYTNLDPFPVFDTMLIPSVISRLANLTIPLSAAAGYDCVYIKVFDQSPKSTFTSSDTASSITILTDSLLKFSPSSMAYLRINLTKYSTSNFGGKSALFLTRKTFVKSVLIQ